MSKSGTITKIAGPLIVAEGVPEAGMYDVVKVGDEKLTGEIIEIRGNRVWIQVYEETSGLAIGEPVISTGEPLSLQLGPGLMSSFYDGIQRPLEKIAAKSGIYINRGIEVPSLDLEKKWAFTPTVKSGDTVQGGDVIGTVQETELILHSVMVPPNVSGKLSEIKSAGEYTVQDAIAMIQTDKGDKPLTMVQTWPIRVPRPSRRKQLPVEPLFTGQRVVDMFFPVMKGGTANVPGPFGSGKTVVQHQLAKWADADIVIFIGCGERGNEMTDVLKEFPELIDPKSGKPLMKRTILIANTSNMPIAAREASIYTGITIAEFYRDMGYNVALMADSTSRWAEALREISGRLEEMPGEEGYPAYLASRIAEFYERAGVVSCLGSDESRSGSVTAIGAISPPGGDLSEPVSQSSLRVTKVFWALDGSLAYSRHYPAIHWLTSYSLYQDDVEAYFEKHLDAEIPKLRREAMAILQKEAELLEIIRIVGMDSLSNQERILLDTAKSLREDYLQQNAFDDIDSFSSLRKQGVMLRIILGIYRASLVIAKDVPDVEVEELFNSPVHEKVAGMKYVPEEQLDDLDKMLKGIDKELRKHLKLHQHDASEEPVRQPLHKIVSNLDTLEE